MERRTFLGTGLAAALIGSDWGAPARLTPRIRQGEPIRLASNENPLGIAPSAREAIVRAMGDANRYPRRRGEIVAAIAERHGVPPESVVLGAGSTEVLKMAVQLLATPSGTLVAASPTYEDPFFYAGPWRVQVIRVPLAEDHAHDLERMREAVRAARPPVLVYICNPNNPTGTLTPSAAVDAWIAEADEDTVFLVDEAYADYVTDSRYWSALRWVPKRPNVLVARTFSKVYGMAGIRLGYGLTHPDMARRMNQLRVRNNANHFAIVAGLASLADRAFVQRSLAVNSRGKVVLHSCLEELELAYLPSHTNFVMHRIAGDVEEFRTRMRDVGIWVGRPFPPMRDHCRVSIGLPAEMERYAETLRAFRRAGHV